MGMDIYGRMPTATEGEYFRANVWTWQPIHTLLVELCHDLMSDELLTAIAFNDGEGPADQEICTKMAERFDTWLSENAEGVTLESPDIQVDEQGWIVSEPELRRDPALKTLSPYHASYESLKEWVLFLRHCGGFSVW